jgi:isocitrate dehydrogenase
MGSAVNPVLREGNSDRRSAPAVKAYARKYPHSMGAWFPSSRTKVSYMQGGDFFANEESVTVSKATTVNIEHVGTDGKVTFMKEVALKDGEIMDSTYMSKKKLIAFFEKNIHDAKEQHILLSLHLKATMMKVSDPIMFGHCVRVFFKELFDKHGATLKTIGANPNNGFGDILNKVQLLPKEQREEIEATIAHCFDEVSLPFTRI